MIKHLPRIILPLAIITILIMPGTSLADYEQEMNWPVIYPGDSSGDKVVALTFDDAPMEGCDELLRILADLDVTATFYVNGMYIEERPEVLYEIVDSGHEVGNHTYYHPRLTEVDPGVIVEEIVSTNQLVTNLTGYIPHTFRPPGGRYDSRVTDIAYEFHLTTALWTVTCGDYLEPSTEYIVNTTLSRIRPGGIILLHDGIENTREAVPRIVETLRDRGYEFLTVAGMIERAHGSCPWPWFDETTSEYSGPDVIF